MSIDNIFPQELDRLKFNCQSVLNDLPKKYVDLLSSYMINTVKGESIAYLKWDNDFKRKSLSIILSKYSLSIMIKPSVNALDEKHVQIKEFEYKDDWLLFLCTSLDSFYDFH